MSKKYKTGCVTQRYTKYIINVYKMYVIQSLIIVIILWCSNVQNYGY